MCGTLPSTTKAKKWYDVTCNEATGFAGKTIKISRSSNTDPIQFCGIRIYGLQSEVPKLPAPPGFAVAIAVDYAGAPYMLNDLG